MNHELAGTKLSDEYVHEVRSMNRKYVLRPLVTRHRAWWLLTLSDTPRWAPTMTRVAPNCRELGWTDWARYNDGDVITLTSTKPIEVLTQHGKDIVAALKYYGITKDTCMLSDQLAAPMAAEEWLRLHQIEIGTDEEDDAD